MEIIEKTLTLRLTGSKFDTTIVGSVGGYAQCATRVVLVKGQMSGSY